MSKHFPQLRRAVQPLEAAPSRRWLRPLLAVALLAAFVGAAPAAPAAAAISSPLFETCLLNKINEARADAGRAPVAMASDITDGVRGWSEWMSNNEFRHTTTAERYAILPAGTFTSGENIAWRMDWSQTDCSEIHTMLMNSAGHRANILRSSWRYVGLGAHYAGNNEWWVTEMFFDANGYSPGVPPVESGTRPCSGGVCDSLGVVNGIGEWGLLNALSADASMDEFFFGNPGDLAFMGDWDGDGVATPGLYRQSDGFVYLRNSNTAGIADITFFFGNPGDYPLVGDFNGNGKDSVSIYRSSEAKVYVVNQLGQNGGALGAAEYSYYFGNPGDSPFVGDFDGNGVDTVGLHRASTGFVYFRNSLTQGNADWSFFYGNPGDVILAGDWDDDGDDTVAVYRPSTGRIYVNLENSAGAADYELYVGNYAVATTYGQG